MYTVCLCNVDIFMKTATKNYNIRKITEAVDSQVYQWC